MFRFTIIFLLFLNSLIYALPIAINEQTDSIDLLSKSKIYIDKSAKLTINDIQKEEKGFKDNNKKLLGFGYSPNFNVWIKFTIYNDTDKVLNKIIEYDNPLTTNVEFFDPNKSYRKELGGLFFRDSEKKNISPTFNIQIKPNESNTYYIKASSHITTLIVKLNLWSNDSFFDKELKHQIILALFFGAMFILGIYNLFIYFFTKDRSYLYYVMYIVGIIIHHLLYVGVANIYFLNTYWMVKIVEMSSVVVAIPVLALGLFTKHFLQTKQYPKNNIILNTFLVLIPISIIFFLITDEYDRFRNAITMLLLIYLMILTLYATIKKNKQAYFILFGWIIFLSSGMLMFLSSAGIFNIYEYIPYLIETSFTFEAIIFSIALAYRINILQKEKNEANERLIVQEQNEKKTLENKVELKTKDLRKALDEKSILLKELNHRVKNNMQTIVSLIRLQNDEIENEKLNDVLVTIQNRINAMSHLHELLYKQDNISHINAYEYFDILIEEIEDSYDSNITIHKNVTTDLKMEQAVYCGLILNELITNSFKYAFPNKEGNIYINLNKELDILTLTVKDDGIGYKKAQSSNSLGLILIDTLSKVQLKGTVNIDSSKGVEVNISWKEYN